MILPDVPLLRNALTICNILIVIAFVDCSVAANDSFVEKFLFDEWRLSFLLHTKLIPLLDADDTARDDKERLMRRSK
jgi:hypothetical protein